MGAAHVTVTSSEEAGILLHVCLVNEDSGAFGTEVVKAIESIDELDVKTYGTAAEAEQRVAEGEAAAAMGMMIAGVARSGNQASNIGVILGLVLAVIGGCLPVAGGNTYRAGGFIGTLARLTPHAHALEGYFRLMMENGTVVTVLPQMGILLAFSVVFFLIAVWRFKFE